MSNLQCFCGYNAPSLSKLHRHQQGPNCGSTPTSRMIDASKAKWPGLFTYDDMKYFKGKITNISCKKHGLFDTSNHLTTSFGGCPGCVTKPTFDSFVARARVTHGDEFEYDRDSFVNMSSDVKMTHKKCGRQLCINAADHVRSTGCLECWKNPTPLEPVILDLLPYDGKVLEHPKYKGHGWDVNERSVVNLKTGKLFKKNRKRHGWYKEFNFIFESKRINTHEHVFLYECFHQVDATGYEIDHINNDHTDDRIQNLQRLTKRDHCRKTSATHNGEIGQKIAKTQGHSGVARNPQTDQVIEFESIRQLAKKIGVDAPNIHRFLRTGKSPPGLFSDITFDSHDYFPDELFKTHPTLHIEVSNYGRVRHGRRMTYGSNDAYGYCIYSSKRVHDLVLETFVGQRPSNDHTGDHKDRNTSNNRLNNLRWSSPSEQIMNQCNKHIHTVVNGYTAEIIGTFSKISDAKITLNITSTFHKVSGIREWFTFYDDKTLLSRRIEFVRKRLRQAPGSMYMRGRTWSCVASGFFQNYDLTERKISREASILEKELFKKQQIASNCIKFHIKSWLCFKHIMQHIRNLK